VTTVAQLARHLEGEADDSIVMLAPGGVLVIPAAVGLEARHYPSVRQVHETLALNADTPDCIVDEIHPDGTITISRPQINAARQADAESTGPHPGGVR
jgi:hypothetical protein